MSSFNFCLHHHQTNTEGMTEQFSEAPLVLVHFVPIITSVGASIPIYVTTFGFVISPIFALCCKVYNICYWDMLRRINSHDLIIRSCQDWSCIMDMTTILTNSNRQERKVFGQRVCLVPFTITDKPCLFFSDDHNTLLFFRIVYVVSVKTRIWVSNT